MMAIDDCERSNEEYSECPYADEEQAHVCPDYFEGMCTDTCFYGANCPMEK